MKRILLVVRTLDSGGISRVIINLAKEMIKSNAEVHILVLSDVINHNIDKNIVLHVLPNYIDSNISKIFRVIDKVIPITSYILSSYYYTTKFKIELNKIESIYGKFDGIFCNGFGAYAGLYRLKDSRVYFCSHSTKSKMIETRCKRFKNLAKITLRSMMKDKNIITVSEGIKYDWINNIGIQAKSIVTIYNIIGISDIKEKSQAIIKEDLYNDYIINVGRFSKEKRHDILIKAFKHSKIDTKLILLGEGPLKDDINYIIKNLDLEDKVVIKGFDSNPYKWIKNAKMLVLSSEYEGLPTVLIEALVCKTMVVSTNCESGPREILEGELKKFLCEVNNVEDLSNKMKLAYYKPINIDDKYIDKFNDTLNCEKYLSLVK